MIKIAGKKITTFNIVNALIMFVLCVLFIIPFWMIITASFSENALLQKNGISFWFQGFSLRGYEYLFEMSDIFLHSLWVSVETSVLAALGTMVVSSLAAYALSKKTLVGRKLFNVFLMITMFFSGGTIPAFLVVRAVGIYDTIWAFILPGLASTYYILLVRNYFYSLPASLEEAATLDGANDAEVFWHIYLPLSVPMIVTVGIMAFIGRWNNWLTSLLYVGATNEELWSVQYVLRIILTNMQQIGGGLADAPTIAARNAGIVIVVMPLVLISPILQKYFISGMTAGAVKG